MKAQFVLLNGNSESQQKFDGGPREANSTSLGARY